MDQKGFLKNIKVLYLKELCNHFFKKKGLLVPNSQSLATQES
jgi:hypothetical protein